MGWQYNVVPVTVGAQYAEFVADALQSALSSEGSDDWELVGVVPYDDGNRNTRASSQPSPDGRSEPDADLLEQGWRKVPVRDENGEQLWAPPSRYSQWGGK